MLEPMRFMVGFFAPILFILFAGTTFLFLGFKAARLPELPYQKYWMAYLVAMPTGYLLFIPVKFCVPWYSLDPMGHLLVQTAVLWITQAVAVPLVLRRFSLKALVVQEIAVLLTNAILFGGAFLLLREGRPGP